MTAPRSKTAAQWASENPILAKGESGFESDTGRSKIGNGHSNWVNRPYVGSQEMQHVFQRLAVLESATGASDLGLAFDLTALAARVAALEFPA